MERTSSGNIENLENGDRDLLDFRDFWRLIKANRILVFIAILTVSSIIMAYGILKGPRYHASVILGISNPNMNSGEDKRIAIIGSSDEIAHKIAILNQFTRSPNFSDGLLHEAMKSEVGASILRSLHGLDRVEYKLGFRPAKLSQLEVRQIPKTMLGQILVNQITFVSDTVNNQFVITALGETPENCTFLAEAAADVLIRENHENILKKVRNVRKFLEDQTADLGAKLQSLEIDLNQFQILTGLISTSEKEKSMYIQLGDFEKDYNQIQAKVIGNRILISEIEKEMTKVKDEINNPTFSASNLYLTQLQHRLSTLNFQKSLTDEAAARSTPQEKDRLDKETRQVIGNFTRALDARMQIKELAMMTPLEYYQVLERELADVRKNQRTDSAMLAGFDKQIGIQHGELTKYSTDLRHVRNLERKITLSSDIYVILKKKLMETLVQEASTLNDVNIIAHAVMPLEAATMSIQTRGLLSLLLGFVLAFALVVLKESALTVVRNRHDLVKMGLGTVMEVPKFAASRGFGHALDDIVMTSKPHSRTADVIRILRIKLMRLVPQKRSDASPQGSVILMTGADGKTGTSFITANLAYACATSGAKTLVIDLNLRNPAMDRFFHISDRKGASSFASGEQMSKPTTRTKVGDNLDVALLDNFDDPFKLLEGDWLEKVLRAARTEYDFIFMDSPAILDHMDAILVAAQADHVVFTVRDRKTHRDDVRSALEKLQEVYRHDVTTILNFHNNEFADNRSLQSH